MTDITNTIVNVILAPKSDTYIIVNTMFENIDSG